MEQLACRQMSVISNVSSITAVTDLIHCRDCAIITLECCNSDGGCADGYENAVKAAAAKVGR